MEANHSGASQPRPALPTSLEAAEKNSQSIARITGNYLLSAVYLACTVFVLVFMGFISNLFGINSSAIIKDISKPASPTNQPSPEAPKPQIRKQSPPVVQIRIQVPATSKPTKDTVLAKEIIKEQLTEPTEGEIVIFESNGRERAFRKIELSRDTTKYLDVQPPINNSDDVDTVNAPEYNLVSLKSKVTKYSSVAWTYHLVRPGDILRVVARKYGITLPALMKANRRTINYAWPGEWLIIPYPDAYSRKRSSTHTEI